MPLPTEQEWMAEQEATHGRQVHQCPPAGSGIMPCCGRMPFEVPLWHRMTLDPAQVNCGTEGVGAGLSSEQSDPTPSGLGCDDPTARVGPDPQPAQ